MMTAVAQGSQHGPSIHVHHVAWSRPFAWLALGWRDVWLHPAASLQHGVLIAAFWLLLLVVAGTHPYAIAALISGFMLIGPVLASGLCELSRRQQTGESLTFGASVEGISANSGSLMRFSAVLATLTVLWFVGSVILLDVVLQRPEPSLGDIQYSGFLSAWNTSELVDYLAIGGALALVVLALSVVAVPLMLDRRTGAAEAIRTSVRATAHNLPAMLVWSVLLVVLVGLGFASALLGLVVIVPVMGHATWHAYRDMVDPAAAAELRAVA